MIKIGDTFIGIDGREEVVASIWLNSKTVGVESGLAYSYEEVYKSWYQQQKQSAEECCKVIDNLGRSAKLQEEKIVQLEKRWSELSNWIEEGLLINSDKYDKTGATPYKMFLRVLEATQKKMHDLEEDGE